MTSLTTDQSDVRASKLAAVLAENETLRRQLRHAQRLATVGTMTGMIIHEFNNILTPIMNYAQLATSGDEEMIRKSIEKSAAGSQRACDICSALLGLMRDDVPDPVQADLAELIEQSLLAMGRNLAKDGIDLHVDIPAGTTVTVRPAELKQVMVNLLLNARAAVRLSHGGGSISISASAEAGRIALSVADTGTGIAPEHIDRLFEPFFTTKTGSDGEEPGNGLGLALCKQIITEMGGDIRVESTLGHGATFHLALPA